MEGGGLAALTNQVRPKHRLLIDYSFGNWVIHTSTCLFISLCLFIWARGRAGSPCRDMERVGKKEGKPCL